MGQVKREHLVSGYPLIYHGVFQPPPYSVCMLSMVTPTGVAVIAAHNWECRGSLKIPGIIHCRGVCGRTLWLFVSPTQPQTPLLPDGEEVRYGDFMPHRVNEIKQLRLQVMHRPIGK